MIIIHFVPIRSAVYIYKLLRHNLPIYDKIFAKPHEKSQGKNFTSLFLSLIDLNKKSLCLPFNMVPNMRKEVSLYFFPSILSVWKEPTVLGPPCTSALVHCTALPLDTVHWNTAQVSGA